MTSRFPILLVAFLAFTVYSLIVTASHGYTGFLTLALREPWAMQMLIDLVIALLLFLVWARRDARARGIDLLAVRHRHPVSGLGRRARLPGGPRGQGPARLTRA